MPGEISTTRQPKEVYKSIHMIIKRMVTPNENEQQQNREGVWYRNQINYETQLAARVKKRPKPNRELIKEEKSTDKIIEMNL